jgi:cytochrome P450
LLNRKKELQYVSALVHRYGDFIKLPLPGSRVYLLNHPDYVKHVLQDNHPNYIRHLTFERFKLVLGENLLTSEGEFWRRRRRLEQPAFQHKQIAEYAQIFTESTASMLQRWERIYQNDKPIDAHRESMHLAMDIVSRALFSTILGSEWEDAVRAFAVTQEWGYRRRWVRIPLVLPTPWNLRFRKACKTLDRIVYDIIAKRRQINGNRTDLLGLLMGARDEAGRGLSDKELRDEVLMLFSAGHETTANNLAWSCFLLSQNPAAARKLEAEVDQVLQGRIPTAEDASRLRYTKMVIQESLRLYPPARVILRSAIKSDRIAGYEIPSGSIVMFFQWSLHRHPEFWKNPEEFDPERFSPERSRGYHPYAFFPFGGGPRMCIGSEFALLEAQPALAMIVQRFRLKVVPGHTVEPDPVVTLKPKSGILMRLDKRH